MSLVGIKDARVKIGRNQMLQISEFQLKAGQHWCIFGGNGAGKTLLAKLIGGRLVHGRQYVSYDEGFKPGSDQLEVSFEEQQRLWERDNRHDMSEFMESAHDLGTTVEGLLAQELTGEEPARGEILQILETLGIAQLQKKGIRFLSSGQVRKVLIARALLAKKAGHAKLLILDDPLDAIDKNSKPVASSLLEQWMDKDNCTMLLCRREEDILPGITHMAVMQDLSIVCQGEIEEVRQSDDYRSLVDTKPQLNLASLLQHETEQESEKDDVVSPINLIDVTAKYGELVVLNKINWHMQPHHHALIEGPNGCGKSTLLSLIDGENHKAYGQQVILFGKQRGSGESVWEIKSHFGVISNEIHNKYVKGWKVIDVVVSGFFDSVGLYDDTGSKQIDAAIGWLNSLGIAHLARSYYQDLSFGEQRVVLLARAMVKQPDVLILDEPSVGLDSFFRELILTAIDEIAANTSTQIIFVSHTDGEAPDCINQQISFIKSEGGGYRLLVKDLSP